MFVRKAAAGENSLYDPITESAPIKQEYDVRILVIEEKRTVAKAMISGVKLKQKAKSSYVDHFLGRVLIGSRLSWCPSTFYKLRTMTR
jgi:hypothetical protein